MIILQISPENSLGTGVGGVVNQLEAQWRAAGHEVRWFGPKEAGSSWLADPTNGLTGRLKHVGSVVWFSTVGTLRARAAIDRLPPGSVSVCHNDALAGDVYVNHGLLGKAMKARGHYHWRMVRNPLHLFTAARDRFRFTRPIHRVVVSLSRLDDQTLSKTYGLPGGQREVIANGVPLHRFAIPSEKERASARKALALPTDARVAVFVGHEFDRKGLPVLLDAMSELDDHHLVVVGGSSAQLRAQRKRLTQDVADRVRWLGRVPDPRLALAAADVLVLPSAYEANPLVVLEALASGLQVVATPVGSVPEVLRDDEVSRIVLRSPAAVAEGLRALACPGVPSEEVRCRARRRAAEYDWSVIAQSYVDLFERVLATRENLVG